MSYKIQFKKPAILSLVLLIVACEHKESFIPSVVFEENSILKYQVYDKDSIILIEQRIDSAGLLQFEHYQISDSNWVVRWYDELGRIERTVNYQGKATYQEISYRNGVIQYSYGMKNGIEDGVWMYYEKGRIHSKLYFSKDKPLGMKKVVNSPPFLHGFDRPTWIKPCFKREILWPGNDQLVHWQENYDRTGELLSKFMVIDKNEFDSIEYNLKINDIPGKVLSPN